MKTLLLLLLPFACFGQKDCKHSNTATLTTYPVMHKCQGCGKVQKEDFVLYYANDTGDLKEAYISNPENLVTMYWMLLECGDNQQELTAGKHPFIVSKEYQRENNCKCVIANWKEISFYEYQLFTETQVKK